MYTNPSAYQTQKFCPDCGKNTLHIDALTHAGCLLTMLTCGLFLPVFLLLLTTPHHVCQTCGKRN